MKILAIIGNGMATGRLLDELLNRKAGVQFEIHVFGEESHGCYNRILLGRILGGYTAHDIMLKPIEWFAERGVRYHCGQQVIKLDRMTRTLTTGDNKTLAYDVAVFATGSIPFVPPLEGLLTGPKQLKAGAFLFRTIEDCEQIRSYGRPPSSVVVLGGGLLGLEAAKALSDLGLHVTIVHQPQWLMNTQLDRVGGEYVRRSIERLGIFIRTGETAVGILGDSKVQGVQLKSGDALPADMVVISAGIRPRVDLANGSGLPVNRGILVNDLLATTVPNVYAVGECAEHNRIVYGIVAPIWEQCQVLADVLTGTNPQARYRGSKLFTKLKVAEVDVASMGITEPQNDSDEVVQIIEERRGIYRKMIVRDNKLVGAIVVGDTECTPTLARWFDRGDSLPPNRLDVLCSGDASSADTDPEICNCHHVTQSSIVTAIQDGCTNLQLLANTTKAGTGCGSCRGQLTKLILKQQKTSVPSV